MKTGDYELVIVWANGEKDIYVYASEEDAEDGRAGMLMALGQQIAWAGTRPVFVK